MSYYGYATQYSFPLLLAEANILVQANCWFLVSFVYECLDEIFHGSAMARFLYLRGGSEEVRRGIRTAARLFVTFPFEAAVRTVPPDLKLGCPDALTPVCMKACSPCGAIWQHQGFLPCDARTPRQYN